MIYNKPFFKLQWWERFRKFAGGLDSIDFDDYINTIRDIISNEEDIHNFIELPLKLLFTAIDTNHDGVIQPKEHETYFSIFGLDTSTAKAAFEAIDSNHDGLISKDEFTAAAVEFYTSKEDTPTKFFFGPLVE